MSTRSKRNLVRYVYYFVLVAIASGYGYATTSMLRNNALVANKSADALLKAQR